MTDWRAIFLALVLLVPSVAAVGESDRGLVLVAGASGRTGIQVLRYLRDQGYAIRALTTNRERAIERHGDSWDWVEADVRDPERLAEVTKDVDYVISAIGARTWEGPSSPEFIDFGGVQNLADAAVTVEAKHFVLVSSAAAGPHRTRSNMAQMGNVRYWKTRGEDHLKLSGLSYTIIGPGGLVNEPSGGEGLRVLSRRDYEGGAITVGDVAMLVVDALSNPDSKNKTFAAIRDDALPPDAWRELLKFIQPDTATDEKPPTAD
ncbi:MAG: SDR family oxidoreductase [Gammaproteobacteria bacterium]|nr:SDR family oxidoreductase [Gammaproteobacteria bacterium]